MAAYRMAHLVQHALERKAAATYNYRLDIVDPDGPPADSCFFDVIGRESAETLIPWILLTSIYSYM